jgi:hypothetical protein
MAEVREQSSRNETDIVKYNHLLRCAICLVYACYFSSADDKFGIGSNRGHGFKKLQWNFKFIYSDGDNNGGIPEA